VNILVNNAGFTWDAVIHKMTDKQWNTMCALLPSLPSPAPSLILVAPRLDCHATAPFRLIRALASHMRSSTETNKVIINISSTSGLHGNAGQLNYSAAKSAVLGMTKTIAKEWGAFGVRCNAVAFGFIDTRLTQSKGNSAVEVDGQKVVLGIPDGMRDMAVAMIPLQRHGSPEEAAGGILMLVSPYAGYVTGHTLEVTGGFGI
jgi:3-oxoacyl-[acyl-carrier protein] reductase